MPSAMPETPMFLSWHHCLLDLQCSWCTWQPFLLQAQALTQPEVLVQPSSTTKTKLGMTTGSSG
uniref:Uncharacterized protein n=1 Tax=Populus trichocarpa TaxID=3694 RepID=A9PI68_POPTR|nr:unknown [Populus trichocarpa]